MNKIIATVITFAATVIGVILYLSQQSDAQNASAAAIGIAEYNAKGDLKVPDNLEEWIHLGSSLGMGYSQQEFDPDSPGNFQIATMEPEAYRQFKETGEFSDGTMFALLFYQAKNRISINRAGFVMGDPFSYEIHIKDKNRFPKPGYNFVIFNPDQKGEFIKPVELPNNCVQCHQANAAYNGVFAQFYPAMQKILAEHGIDISQDLVSESPHR